ncbi:D-alanyl-D-alanine carboxypeptidase [Streptomyces sp. ADMS]|uniref:D-alanyl-D-alanine carboxypeptidase n=1 Tax=Streptomyces sp. ADMS TaxID=3071415 RepID=UPI00296F0391|nr:D-alanyl-D-alanine carboxypeptidase [Streptomyces sp. ADMS]MDW4903915.1 D-alanyl-D-alanine carboxypeptidase [Streptomyces sp. ADMS]
MEEASVAGESPDRSKQRESSEEPTSGSTGPVPGARSESGAGVRDPRLAVARDREPTARGGVDTATRVFSRAELPAEAADADVDADTDAEVGAADTAAEAADGPGDATEAGSADGTDGSGSTRLRAAVAAWVASADEGEGKSEGVEGAAEKDGPDADAEPAPDADAPADAPEGGEEPVADAGGDAGPDGPSGAADRVPGAAGGASGDADEDSSEPESAQESESTPEPDSESDSKAAVEGRPEIKPELKGAVGSGSEPGAEADIASALDPDPGAGANPDAGPDPSGVLAPKPPVDQPTAVFKAVRPPAAPQVDQPTTMLKLGDLPAGKAKAAEKPEGGDKSGDQGDADAKSDARDANGESVAERTSKFVALRQLDDPATRKPPPATPHAGTPVAQPPKAAAADATAAIPQVGPERTTQQPLPPKPPLDLLAELTNTPPPRDTAVRTIARRVKIWTPVVILLAIVFAVVQTMRPLPTPELTLTAKDSYTFDGKAAALPWPNEGQGWMDVNGIGAMGNFGEQTPVAIGSVAKAMTAYVVLKGHPLKAGEEGTKIEIDATAEKEGGYNADGESTLPTAKAGDTLTLKQALSAIMIPSANNIARLLARWDAGTEAAFIKKMNDTAKELGMKNTTYTDASGLKDTTVSSAEDQVKLGHELVKIPALMDITRQPYWIDPSGQRWRNYNDLVPYNGAIGIKTGTTTVAGGNLLFAGTREVGGETVTVVGAILGQHTPPIIDTVNDVSETALIAAREALLSSKILKKGDVVGYVDDGLGGRTPVVLSKDVTAVGWAGLKVELSFDAADELPHSAKAGTAVGTLTVGDGSGGAVEVPVQLQKDLVEPGFDKKLTRVG